MTSFVKLILVICAAACCNQLLVTGRLLAASTGRKIRDVEPLPPLPPVSPLPTFQCLLVTPDGVFPIPEGGNHTHGCDFYECRNGQMIEDIHQCENALAEHDQDLCLQWSEDRCCCDRIGCLDINDEVKELGEMYLKFRSSDPDSPQCCLCQGGPIRLCLDDTRTAECTEDQPLPSQ